VAKSVGEALYCDRAAGHGLEVFEGDGSDLIMVKGFSDENLGVVAATLPASWVSGLRIGANSEQFNVVLCFARQGF
jgi:hypothetical protein